MSTNRQKDFDNDVKDISKRFLRAKMPEAKILDGEICLDLDKMMFNYSWVKHKIVSGGELDFIFKLGYAKCLKKEATVLLYVGEKIDGFFVSSKTKSFWLKQKL